MKAIHLTGTGSVDNFKVVDLPKPVPGDNEVLVKSKAAGVMYADIMQRRGGYVLQPELPFIPGKEVSGEKMNRYLEKWLQTEKLLSPTKSFALEDVGAAHTWIETQKAYGKIVLDV